MTRFRLATGLGDAGLEPTVAALARLPAFRASPVKLVVDDVEQPAGPAWTDAMLRARKEAIEVKDVKGKIDTDQYDAYVANIRNRKHVDGKPVERLKYVFTEPEGAMANLKFFIEQFGKESMAGKLTVEVFDSGRKPQRLVIEGKNAVADATAELARLQAKFKKAKP